MSVIVTIAVHPHGDRSRERVIHKLEIANASEDGECCDYVVHHEENGRNVRRFKVKGHLKVLGVVALVRKVLEELRS